MGIDWEYCEISYGGGGRPSLAVGDLVPLTMEFSDGENIPRPDGNDTGVPEDW